MRLGVGGMLPPDPRDITEQHLRAIADLRLTGIGSRAAAPELSGITAADCVELKARLRTADIDLVQFSVGYAECLFDPDAAVRDQVVELIGRGIEVGGALDAHFVLIRPGSLNSDGSYAPDPANHTPEAREGLVDTLGRVAAKAEAEGVTVVIETHLLTIMDSPESNRDILAQVGSNRLTVVMDYVNHFQTMHQVFNSTDRLNHIYDVMGPVSGVGHCKDMVVDSGLTLHLNESMPGQGQLDMVTALRRWEQQFPEGYMLLEHLADEQYPEAAANVHAILADAGIPIH
jgi:sugar phosphate isomerase/epimerase